MQPGQFRDNQNQRRYEPTTPSLQGQYEELIVHVLNLERRERMRQIASVRVSRLFSVYTKNHVEYIHEQDECDCPYCNPPDNP